MTDLEKIAAAAWKTAEQLEQRADEVKSREMEGALIAAATGWVYFAANLEKTL